MGFILGVKSLTFENQLIIHQINRLKKKKPYHHFKRCRKSIYKIKHMFLTKTLSQVDL